MGGTVIGRFCRDSSSCAKSKSRRRGEERCRGDGWRSGESITFIESAMNWGKKYVIGEFTRIEGIYGVEIFVLKGYMQCIL